MDISETPLTKEMDKHDNALSFISSVTQKRRKGKIKINKDTEGVAKIRELVAAFQKRKARIKDKTMNKKVIEYFDNYLGGQLNENTDDEQLNRAVVDLVLLTETVIKFVELHEISHALSRKVFLARRAIAKNIRPDAYKGRSYTNQQIARKNKELIQRSPEGEKLIRKSSAEHLKNLQQKVMARKTPSETEPIASPEERARAKQSGMDKLKKAAASARRPKPLVLTHPSGMPIRHSPTTKEVTPKEVTPKEKRSLSHRLGGLVGRVGRYLEIGVKSSGTDAAAAADAQYKKRRSQRQDSQRTIPESSYHEPEETEYKGVAADRFRRNMAPIIHKTYPGTSEWQAKTLPKGHQLQLTTGQFGRTIRGNVDQGPVERETTNAASNADEISDVIKTKKEREKLGQSQMDFNPKKTSRLDSLVTRIPKSKSKASAASRSREVGSSSKPADSTTSKINKFRRIKINNTHNPHNIQGTKKGSEANK